MIVSAGQGAAFVKMVVANNVMRKIRAAVIADQGMFRNINNVSVTTTDHILRGNHMSMVHRYTVTFQRNSDVLKEARYPYVEVRKRYVVYCLVISCT